MSAAVRAPGENEPDPEAGSGAGHLHPVASLHTHGGHPTVRLHLHPALLHSHFHLVGCLFVTIFVEKLFTVKLKNFISSIKFVFYSGEMFFMHKFFSTKGL